MFAQYFLFFPFLIDFLFGCAYPIWCFGLFCYIYSDWFIYIFMYCGFISVFVPVYRTIKQTEMSRIDKKAEIKSRFDCCVECPGNRNWSQPHYLFSGNKSRISLIWFRFSELTDNRKEERNIERKWHLSCVSCLSRVTELKFVVLLSHLFSLLNLVSALFLRRRLFHHILFKIIRFLRVRV